MTMEYGTITGRLVAAVADTPDDPDVNPDIVPITGTVTFTPSVKAILVASESVTVVPAPIVAVLDANGYVSLNGVQSVTVLATNSTYYNPNGWTYRVSFDNLAANGRRVTFDPYNIEVPVGSTVDLSSVTPITGSTGTPIVRGPAGPTGDSAYQAWLKQGNTGTQADFLASLKGVKGDPGTAGNDATTASYFSSPTPTQTQAAADNRYTITAIKREALAAGKRRKSFLTGNLTEVPNGVSADPITTLVAASSVSIGTASFATSGNLITTSVPHNLAVGNAVAFGTMSNATGVNAGDLYYVISVPSTTTLTVSGSPGGSARTITAAGTSVAVYRRELAYLRSSSMVNPVLRTTETRAVQSNANFPRWDYIAADPSIITTGTGTGTYTNMRIETEYTGDRLGLLFRNTGSLLGTVLVDGRMLGSFSGTSLTNAGVASGDLGRYTLVFASKRRRTITILFDSLSEFGGLDLQPGFELIYPTATPKGARVLWVGDSFTEGTGAGTSWSYVRWLSFLMGWNDIWKCGSGGTGYVKALDTGRPALISRYQNDIIAQLPQTVVIAMGLNDQTSYETDPNNFLSAVTTIWDAVLAQSGIKELVIIGPWPNGGGSGVVASLIDMDAKLKGLAEARQIRYISPINEGWTFTRADATHPDPAGHELIATRLAGHLSVAYA